MGRPSRRVCVRSAALSGALLGLFGSLAAPAPAPAPAPAGAAPLHPSTHASALERRGAPTTRAVATSGGITVRLDATPARPKRRSVVHITVTVSDAAARGALFYDISFGDGTSAAAFAPQYCRPLPRAAHQTWHLEHRYTTAGTFRLEVKVSAVCTPGNAAVSVRLRVH